MERFPWSSNMMDFSSRPSRMNWQYEQSRSVWQRLSKMQAWVSAGLIILMLFLVYLIFGKALTRMPDLSTPTGFDHPVVHLVSEARASFWKQTKRQSSSFLEAVQQYKERYGISAPPHFDKWYEFAQTNSVPLIDEYDDIFQQLKPFWGISPATIRRQVATAIATNEFVIGFHFRSGEITLTQHGEEWRGGAIRIAIEPFAHLLPDMDIAFNRHDEPRSIIPYDQLAQLLHRAEQRQTLHSATCSTWSEPPVDLDNMLDGQIKRSPFIECVRPFTWPISTLSCPPDTPARVLNFDGTDHVNADMAYLLPPFEFVQNRTAVTDICHQPSLRGVHSFFNSPNSWSITHDPFPIFSPSKPSTFHDILYPAPWYLGDKVTFDPAEDVAWSEKQDALYWRGSTTGGWSEHGIWQMQQRQRFVESVEKPGKGFILQNISSGHRKVEEVKREDYGHWFDVHFYAVDFCSEEDCEAQEGFFDVRPKDPFEANWKNKFLLDMDGHAFSGRFYTFLQSGSLTLKQALFREWHETRILPWVHYIPLGFNETEHLGLLRFFIEEEDGRSLAQGIAEESSRWAKKSLRHVDMQAWMFRLLLEYARLVDDGRDRLGFLT